MTTKTAVITIIIFGIIIVIAAYIQRGYWAVGIEWALPVVLAAVVPLEEGGRRCQKKN